MRGLAQEKYEEISGKGFRQAPSEKKWPLLEAALKAGCISYEDFALAEYLLQNTGETSELGAAFICHLSRSAREGHLSVKMENGRLFPSPVAMWLSDPSLEAPKELRALLEKLQGGEAPIPDSILAQVKEDDAGVPMRPLCLFEGNYYFQKYWLFESSASNAFRMLIAQKPSIQIDQSHIEKALLRMKAQNLVNEAQENALRKGCGCSLSIICGGPGTGKTYTAGHMIKLFWEALTDDEKEHCEIALAAPTGKAAQNLQKSMEAAFRGLEGKKPEITAGTLHALLDLPVQGNKNEMGGAVKLTADLILVDESSMIDVRMLSFLFNSVKSGARLILLGDPCQLPPVEAGSLFKDIINVLRMLPESPVFELQDCLRAELKEIVEISHLVNAGNVPGFFEHLSGAEKMGAVSRIAASFEGQGIAAKEFLLEQAERNIPFIPYHDQLDPTEVLLAFNRYRILSPLKRGIFGVAEINRQLHQKRLEKVKWGEFYLAPIIISANDHKMNLFNGEVGVLVFRKKQGVIAEKGDFALFSGNGTEPYRKIPAILLPKFDLSYAMSVHKSQGSEFDHVFLLLPPGSERFGREVLYTAVTRAKKRLEIWGEENTLVATLLNPSLRVSGMQHRKFS